jgi:hypothetical protein
VGARIALQAGKPMAAVRAVEAMRIARVFFMAWVSVDPMRSIWRLTLRAP